MDELEGWEETATFCRVKDIHGEYVFIPTGFNRTLMPKDNGERKMTQEELRFYIPAHCFGGKKTVIDQIWEDSILNKQESHRTFQNWVKRK